MRGFVLASVGLWLGLASIGHAQSESAVIVELFTSQGCSSCPPADDYLAEIAGRDDVIALSLHVDYWDYIGWKDTLGSPAFTDRQHAYAAAARARSVYTPQFVVGGVDHVVGNGPSEVAGLIRTHDQKPEVVALSLDRSGDSIEITANARSALPQGAVIQLVHYTPETTVAIKRGENSGRTITYYNVVTSIDVIGKWNGDGAYHTKAKSGTGPVVVIVQTPGMGPILAAARLK